MKNKNSLIEAFRRIFFQSSTYFIIFVKKALYGLILAIKIKLSSPLLEVLNYFVLCNSLKRYKLYYFLNVCLCKDINCTTCKWRL